jgi:hypothetical protein
MDTKVMVILLTVFLARFLSPAMCKCTHSSYNIFLHLKEKFRHHDVMWHTYWMFAGEGDVAERSTGGGHRWPPVDGEEISERSKLKLRLCLKNGCGANWKTCYCCVVLPDIPCYYGQQTCWDNCPGAAQPLQPLAPAPKALSPGDFYWL